jgi:hypothetical protein
MVTTYKIIVTGTKPLVFRNRKVLPGETAIISETQYDRSNRHIKLIEEVSEIVYKTTKPKKIRRLKNDGIMES